ncbi:cytoplasmic iron level regulating protein YaaA (DUF328/UPF0246 family) [Microbacterium ginsengiterrae]|uniref:Cytoplasmic iron level regulating protein YaaA (DUF328/UPF0246 family) n=1 Tax=Microbacterium ginsengiterrae TaxID=546115 RepID=A0A7W9CE53_9MICO|nr:peroxide stress protein YaaA [Microbacterium ginsengiterrae]MBB5743854.1 cytoplasmic iron level regulating protein YaaA (DUF328/UPF0246 family) [Microbacterium ginsengiterrae]
MKLLLPPSETKRPGGDGAPLDLAALSLSALTPQRDEAINALVALAEDPARAQRILKLSERQVGEIDHNRALRSSPTMPAVDRYTGVLYDALDAASLSPASREWLGAHAWVHAAPFGPVGALDAIPAYRLAAGTSLPGIAPLKRHWSVAVRSAVEDEAPAFILDLRSEAYVGLGPLPDSVPSAYVRVVTEQGRALNHFNKKAKGTLTRALAEDRPPISTLTDLLQWAHSRDIVLRAGGDTREVELVVPS